MNEKDGIGGSPLGGGSEPPVVPPSLFGSPAQYSRSASEVLAGRQYSATGASVADPAREDSRERVESDPDWASPMRGFTTEMGGIFASLLTYWFSYGFTLAAGSMLASILSSSVELRSGEAYAFILFVGPLCGWFLDLAITFSHSWIAILGVVFAFGEVLLFLLFLFARDWGDRIMYAIATAGFVLVKIVVIVLGGVFA